jgi:hypothetical protein
LVEEKVATLDKSVQVLGGKVKGNTDYCQFGHETAKKCDTARVETIVKIAVSAPGVESLVDKNILELRESTEREKNLVSSELRNKPAQVQP